MLKDLLVLLAKAEQIQIDLARKGEGPITMVVRPNHKLATDHPVLARGVSIQGNTAEELEAALLNTITQFAPVYESTFDQLAAIKAESDAAIKAAKDASAKRAASTTPAGKQVPPAKTPAPAQKKQEPKLSAPPAPSLFGTDETPSQPPPPAPVAVEAEGATNG
jgi:PRTRC genetic system protein E